MTRELIPVLVMVMLRRPGVAGGSEASMTLPLIIVASSLATVVALVMGVLAASRAVRNQEHDQ